jgi:hypothetical protein
MWVTGVHKIATGEGNAWQTLHPCDESRDACPDTSVQHQLKPHTFIRSRKAPQRRRCLAVGTRCITPPPRSRSERNYSLRKRPRIPTRGRVVSQEFVLRNDKISRRTPDQCSVPVYHWLPSLGQDHGATPQGLWPVRLSGFCLSLRVHLARRYRKCQEPTVRPLV